MSKKIILSISDFAVAAPKRGSIDIYSGLGHSQTFGITLHKDIQAELKKKDASYLSEVWTTHTFKYKKYSFEISGRMDGMYQKEKIRIEEIKTAFNAKRLHRYLENSQNSHPFWLQLKTYGYFHWLKTNEIPELNLLLVSQRNKKTIELPIQLEIPLYENWLNNRLNDLFTEIKETEKRIKRRKKQSISLSFPFNKPRQGQEELIKAVKTSMENNSPILIQAPTGLGKTMGILYPALLESLSRGQKVIYITPKNSQHQVALDAVLKLQQFGSKISSIQLTAKKKLCMKAEPICNSDYCEFAENHYTKVEENKLLEKLQKQKNLTTNQFKEIAKIYKICPYELQMDSIPYIDVVICDYNYVFSPPSLGSRICQTKLGETQKPNLVIDEIHNLPVRAMDYYSPMLSAIVLEKMYYAIQKIHSFFQEGFSKLIKECILIVKNCKSPKVAGSHKIKPPSKIFKEQEIKLQEFVNNYLESDIEIIENDLILMFYNYWTEFTAALEFVNDDCKEFFTSYLTDLEAIKITCCDASKMLIPCYNNYKQVMGFSATLKPFNYYSSLIGLNNPSLQTAEFLSPFPKKNRKILIIPQISSKFSERSRNYSRIVEVIKKIVLIKPGNYFIFFPSFDFLNQVRKLYPSDPHFKIVEQKAQMNQQEISKILADLNNSNVHHLIFAVQGGVFSEGVDYPGSMIIGAFIIGPPLPIFDWQRDQMKKYYEIQYSSGFDYAYTYPAMAKAIQAAGRVIRSENDKGIIILIDNRFLLHNYYKCMPVDWFEQTPTELVSNSILHDLKRFWD